MKRFTETEKWRDVWYRRLTPVQKCLWHYLCDNCDPAGVIELDLELASFQIGDSISGRDLEALAKGIETLSSGKLWVRAFVRFQFGQLSEACAPHKQVFAALKKHGISVSTCYEIKPQTLTEPLAKGSLTLKDKDKDKDKDPKGEGMGEGQNEPREPSKSPIQRRAEMLFKRREATRWGTSETKAWKANRASIEPTPEEDWLLLEWFYGIPEDNTYRRRDLATLLNNWTAEVDRARAFKDRQNNGTKPYGQPQRPSVI